MILLKKIDNNQILDLDSILLDNIKKSVIEINTISQIDKYTLLINDKIFNKSILSYFIKLIDPSSFNDFLNIKEIYSIINKKFIKIEKADNKSIIIENIIYNDLHLNYLVKLFKLYKTPLLKEVLPILNDKPLLKSLIKLSYTIS